MNPMLAKICHKVSLPEQSYIWFLGLHIPYSVHRERFSDQEADCWDYYVHIKGFEWRYKRVKIEQPEYTVPPRLSNILNYVLCDRFTDADRRRLTEHDYYQVTGHFPDLDNPKRLTEKIYWLFLFRRDPLHSTVTDKATAKKWIAERVGKEYIVPVYGIYDGPEQIDFDSLPDSFTVKSTTGSMGLEVIPVRDKHRIDTDNLRSVLSSWLYSWENYYYETGGISPETNHPRLLIEKYLEQGDGHKKVTDYKWFCFNGEPKFGIFTSDRFLPEMRYTLVDTGGKPVPFSFSTSPAGYTSHFPMPVNFDKMLELSRILSKDFPLARIDFYEIQGRLYVGEITLTPLGFRILPDEWDVDLGQELDISADIDAYRRKREEDNKC